MDLNDEVEVPPPYTDVPKGPPAPSYPSTATGYAHPTAPTFEPPYMSQPHGTMTSITVQGGRGPMVPGSCPVCGNPSWTGTYSCFAWFLCLFCFWNFGLCCCLCMRKKKCTKCGYTVG